MAGWYVGLFAQLPAWALSGRTNWTRAAGRTAMGTVRTQAVGDTLSTAFPLVTSKSVPSGEEPQQPGRRNFQPRREIRLAAQVIATRERVIDALRACQRAPLAEATGHDRYLRYWDELTYALTLRNPRFWTEYWKKASARGRKPEAAAARLVNPAKRALDAFFKAVLEAAGTTGCRLFEHPWNADANPNVLCISTQSSRGTLRWSVHRVPFKAAADPSQKLGRIEDLAVDASNWQTEVPYNPRGVSLPIVISAALKQSFPGQAPDPPQHPNESYAAPMFSVIWQWAFSSNPAPDSPIFLASASQGAKGIKQRDVPDIANAVRLLLKSGHLPERVRPQFRELLAKHDALPPYPGHLRGTVLFSDDGLFPLFMQAMHDGLLSSIDEEELFELGWRQDYPEGLPFRKADAWAVLGHVNTLQPAPSKVESIPIWVLTNGRQLSGRLGKVELSRDQAILNYLAYSNAGPRLPQIELEGVLGMEAAAVRKALHDLRKKRSKVGLPPTHDEMDSRLGLDEVPDGVQDMMEPKSAGYPKERRK